MDKEQKTLKSPLSAKYCVECKAQVAGEAQRSLAKELLARMEGGNPVLHGWSNHLAKLRYFLEGFLQERK